jgi:hypothetical protein
VRAPWGEQAVLATDAEAAKLRRLGYLIEPDLSVAEQTSLAEGGFELPAFSEWRFDREGPRSEAVLGRCLVRVGALARGRIPLTLALRPDGSFEITIAARRFVWRWTGADGRPTLDVLAALCREVNERLAVLRHTERLAIMTASPQAHAPRLLLLGPAWRAAALRAPGLRLDSLDAGAAAEAATTVPAPRAYPRPPIDEALARLPRPEEIVGTRQVQYSDYKCSSPEEDVPSVVCQLARFAKVRLTCESPARLAGDGRRFDVTVRVGAVAATIAVEQAKYPDVQPILDFLNGIRAARGEERRLYVVVEGKYGRGVLLATDEQAADLRALACLVER